MEDWLNMLFVRSVFTAYMHCAATATFGAGISRLKNLSGRAILSVIGFYIIAWSLHASWNTLVTVESPDAVGFGILLLLLYFGVIFSLFAFGIRKERRQRKEVLTEGFSSGVLPSQFEKVLLSYRAMRKGGWFPEYLNKDKYLSLVSRLVSSKSAYTRANENRRKAIEEEIALIRRELRRFSDLIGQVQK